MLFKFFVPKYKYFKKAACSLRSLEVSFCSCSSHVHTRSSVFSLYLVLQFLQFQIVPWLCHFLSCPYSKGSSYHIHLHSFHRLFFFQLSTTFPNNKVDCFIMVSYMLFLRLLLIFLLQSLYYSVVYFLFICVLISKCYSEIFILFTYFYSVSIKL